jgi:hypothetical protein
VDNLIYQLPTILKPLDLAALFSQAPAQPLEVELGCGDASFIVEYARRNPATNFIGVERLLGRLQKLDRKGRRAGLGNLRGVPALSAAAEFSRGAAHLFSRSVAQEEAPPAPAHRRTVSLTGPRRARAGRADLSADG